jgi:hypothetical protein
MNWQYNALVRGNKLLLMVLFDSILLRHVAKDNAIKRQSDEHPEHQRMLQHNAAEMHQQQCMRRCPGQQCNQKRFRQSLRSQRTSILNQFRMKLMKVICNMKNILNKECEHDEEL